MDSVGADWEEEETYGAEIEKRATVEGKSKSGLDSLWEDSWDDDGIEDDFSLQLRSVSSFDRIRLDLVPSATLTLAGLRR